MSYLSALKESLRYPRLNSAPELHKSARKHHKSNLATTENGGTLTSNTVTIGTHNISGLRVASALHRAVLHIDNALFMGRSAIVQSSTAHIYVCLRFACSVVNSPPSKQTCPSPTKPLWQKHLYSLPPSTSDTHCASLAQVCVPDAHASCSKK